MSDSDRQEMIDQFCEVTGTSVDQARHFLEAENWTLQVLTTRLLKTMATKCIQYCIVLCLKISACFIEFLRNR